MIGIANPYLILVRQLPSEAIEQRLVSIQNSKLKSKKTGQTVIIRYFAIQDVPQGHPESLIKADLQSALN
ncbi:hypothetical protein [Sphingobacterium hungaricum]